MDEEEEPAAVERVRIELNSLKHCLGKSDLNGAKDAGCVVILSSFEAVAKFTSSQTERPIFKFRNSRSIIRTSSTGLGDVMLSSRFFCVWLEGNVFTSLSIDEALRDFWRKHI